MLSVLQQDTMFRELADKIVEFLDVYGALKTASRKPDSPAERKTLPNPKTGPFREVGTLITLIDKPDTFREKETENQETEK